MRTWEAGDEAATKREKLPELNEGRGRQIKETVWSVRVTKRSSRRGKAGITYER
jgi:hypothetical protein